MILLQTSVRQAILAQNVLADVRLENVFDLSIEQQSSNSWLLNFDFFYDDEDFVEILEDIRIILAHHGLTEIELNSQN